MSITSTGPTSSGWTSPGATHPILTAASDIHAALDEVGEVQPAYMSPAQKEAALAELATAQTRLAELELRIAATADDVAADHGARDIAPWWADHLKADPGTTRRRVTLARALDRTYGLVRTAMAEGRICEAKAQIIVTALEALPDDLDPDTLTRAEQLMVDEAPAGPRPPCASWAASCCTPSPPTSPRRPRPSASKTKSATPATAPP